MGTIKDRVSTRSGVIERHRAAPAVAVARGQYEYRTLTIPATTSTGDARRLLTDEAEYGRWELARTRLFVGGRREVLLRRRVIRVTSTL